MFINKLAFELFQYLCYPCYQPARVAYLNRQIVQTLIWWTGSGKKNSGTAKGSGQ
jgi:hypothetical protein